MPKKVHGRPNKAKSRARRPQQQRPVMPAPDTVEMQEEAPAAVPVAAPVRPRAATAAPQSAAPSASTAARRAAQRRAPVIAINYSYLRHDLRMLAVLAPLMVVLLVVAYAVLHNV